MIYFVTGTDTDAGKTVVTAGLLAAAGSGSLGLKPIAAGCEATAAGLRNSDALSLQAASGIKLPYEQVNPIAYQPAIAPHIAAQAEPEPLTVARLTPLLPTAAMAQASLCLVEGAGGWRLPLNHQQTMPQWVAQQRWPVILVVGMKLGCLNHALLTAEAIRHDGLQLVGWIANRVDADMSCYQQNLETLQAMLAAPMLAEVPFLADVNEAAQHLTAAAQRLQTKSLN
ncbi:dethiobiotin synthase [uncultured Ferrimonas sp.]|uniref:dethiobiotin synthase n=1 Tax=uncultured Ferrimonas sp. TaxID=432640 RepID=UPI0026318AE6|nr:dethiobiotin synthase [uncultured Ferrimonas sp.]